MDGVSACKIILLMPDNHIKELFFRSTRSTVYGLCSLLCECVNMKSCMEFSIYIFIYKQDDMMLLKGRALAFVVVLAWKLHRNSLRFSLYTLHIVLFM